MNPINLSTESVLREVINNYPYHKQFAPLLDEIDRLRSILVAVEAERDELREQLMAATEQRDAAYALAAAPYEHRAIHAERTLAALREPSEAVVEAHVRGNIAHDLENRHATARECVSAGIRAAVTAAEQEVLHNEGLAQIGQRNAELFKRGDKCRCGKCADFGLVDIDLDSTTAAAEQEVGV